MVDIIQPVTFSAQRIKEISPGMWQDFHNDLRPFQNTSIYSNDFHRYISDEWTVTEVGTSLQEIENIRNGVLRLTSGGTENDGSNLQLGGSADSETLGLSWAPSAGRNLWFEARIQMNDVTQQDFLIGIHSEDTTAIASNGADGIFFRSDDGDALLDVEVRGSSLTSEETGVHTLVDGTFVKLGFKVTGTDKVEFFVNDALQSTLRTNIPTALMKLTIAHLTGETAANELDVDFIVVAQDR